MTARRWVLALIVALLPLHASAQLDDLLTPLTPQSPADKKAQPKKRKVRKQRRTQQVAPPPAGHELHVAPLVPSKTELVVKVVGPEDAEVLLDGEQVHADTPLEVDPGEHTLVVRRPGFAEYTRKIRAKPEKTTEVSAALEALAGVLAVSADVPGGRVFLDGKHLGEAPVTGLIVPPGVHEVKILREGFEDYTSRIAVRAGRDYTVTGTLRPLEGATRTLTAVNGDRPEQTDLVPRFSLNDGSADLPLEPDPAPVVEAVPLHQRWYVWAGAGAVVAAGASVAYLLIRGNSGLPPSQVCLPSACDAVLNPPAIVGF
ncbi:MAG: PEGA domain-containing protein [Myxococcaceae bacterium]